MSGVESFILPAGDCENSLVQFAANFLGFLIGDQPLRTSRVEQRAAFLGADGSAAEQKTSDRRDEHRFSEKHFLSFVVAEAVVG